MFERWQSLPKPFEHIMVGNSRVVETIAIYNARMQVPSDHRSLIIFPTSPIFFRDRHRLADFAVQHKIATVFGLRDWVDAGGLFSYGVNFPAMYRRVAEFVDMVARGAKPADLPVEQPTAFELVINLRTAKALGLTLPSTLVAPANDVIE
jgi:ABC-type uncharacterized transport system substrate-binding protein